MLKRIYRITRLLVIALCSIYALGTLLFCAARAWKPDQIALVSLLNAVFPFLFAPLVLTLPLAAFTRSKMLLLSSIALLAVFAYTYGAFLLPRGSAPSGTDSLRVMTYNIGPGQSTTEDVVTAIGKENADIVALQELGPDLAAVLQARLKTQYPYTVLDAKESTGLMSRHPIRHIQWYQSEGGGRPFLDALVDWHGHPIDFYALHPVQPGIRWYADSIPTGLANDDLDRAILSAAETVDLTEGSRILAGDLNMNDQTIAYAHLSRVLSDSYREAGQGLGFTFPNRLSFHGLRIPGPFVRIDYVFHSDDWKALQASVNCEQSSDHCYVTATLALKP